MSVQHQWTCLNRGKKADSRIRTFHIEMSFFEWNCLSNGWNSCLCSTLSMFQSTFECTLICRSRCSDLGQRVPTPEYQIFDCSAAEAFQCIFGSQRRKYLAWTSTCRTLTRAPHLLQVHPQLLTFPSLYAFPLTFSPSPLCGISDSSVWDISLK